MPKLSRAAWEMLASVASGYSSQLHNFRTRAKLIDEGYLQHHASGRVSLTEKGWQALEEHWRSLKKSLG